MLLAQIAMVQNRRAKWTCRDSVCGRFILDATGVECRLRGGVILAPLGRDGVKAGDGGGDRVEAVEHGEVSDESGGCCASARCGVSTLRTVWLLGGLCKEDPQFGVVRAAVEEDTGGMRVGIPIADGDAVGHGGRVVSGEIVVESYDET